MQTTFPKIELNVSCRSLKILGLEILGPKNILYRFPFFAELFINGPFIFIYALRLVKRVPDFLPGQLISTMIEVGTYCVPFVLTLVTASAFWFSKDIEDFFRKHVFALIILFPLYITFGDAEFAFWLGAAHLLSTILSLYDQEEIEDSPKRLSEIKPFWENLHLTPAQIVLISFMGIILLGTFLLYLPVSAAEGKKIALVDAFFMTTSAACVTGLATVSVKNDLSFFGQMVLLGTFQVGGLGFMTLSSSVGILMGRNMQMKERLIMQDLLEVNELNQIYSMITDIISFTFFIELWGAILLAIGFGIEGLDFGTAVYYGVFHSISAFCNAGFAMWDNSLENFATNPIISITISVLIILGGIGFVVLKELREIATTKRKLLNMSLHSKVVFLMTGLLLVAGSLFVFFGEFLNSLDGYTLWEKTLISFFQSTTLRTAGFNTLPLANIHPYTAYGFMMFMFIGASPGSTGGGIKTTTFAIILQSIRANLTGNKKVTFFDRTIPNSLIVKAIGVAFISIMIVSLFTLVMMQLEPNQGLLPLMFEVMSAFGTVGLSLGVTTQMSAAGKIAIGVLMYIGRVGPLTLALALGERAAKQGKYDYPDGRMIIG